LCLSAFLLEITALIRRRHLNRSAGNAQPARASHPQLILFNIS
jgi:hypothetical protein